MSLLIKSPKRLSVTCLKDAFLVKFDFFLAYDLLISVTGLCYFDQTVYQ